MGKPLAHSSLRRGRLIVETKLFDHDDYKLVVDHSPTSFALTFDKGLLPPVAGQMKASIMQQMITFWRLGGSQVEEVIVDGKLKMHIRVTSTGKSLIVAEANCKFCRTYMQLRAKHFIFQRDWDAVLQRQAKLYEHKLNEVG